MIETVIAGLILAGIIAGIAALKRIWNEGKKEKILNILSGGGGEKLPPPEDLSKVPQTAPPIPGSILKKDPRNRRRAWILLIAGSALILVIALWNPVIMPYIFPPVIENGKVSLLLRSRLWISLDPQHFDPTQNIMPPVDSLDQQLEWLQQSKFTGIITFSSKGTLSALPRLAKRRGMAVIMGVWDPTDEQEVAAAISQHRYADAYSIGHDDVNHSYSYDDLLRTIRYIRLHTRRPVTTTEKVDLYLADDRFLTIGDWIFPDVRLSLRDTSGVTDDFVADANRDVRQIIDWASRLSKHPATGVRPILLKMVRYPMDGIPDASRPEQAAFFELILEARRDARFPRQVSIAYDGAFDTPWKRGWPFYPWDPFTGLFNPDGSPRPAVTEIIERWP